MKGLEVATNIPALALLLSLVGNEVGKVVVRLERRGDTGTARILERVALDDVRDGGARETAAVVGADAVGSKVDLENLLGVRVDDDVEIHGVSVAEEEGTPIRQQAAHSAVERGARRTGGRALECERR